MSFALRMDEIARRKARLVAACARERAELAEALSACRAPIVTLDRGFAASRFFLTRPLALAAAVAVLAALGRGRLMRWAARSLLVWRTWRSVRALLGSRR